MTPDARIQVTALRNPDLTTLYLFPKPSSPRSSHSDSAAQCCCITWRPIDGKLEIINDPPVRTLATTVNRNCIKDFQNDVCAFRDRGNCLLTLYHPLQELNILKLAINRYKIRFIIHDSYQHLLPNMDECLRSRTSKHGMFRRLHLRLAETAFAVLLLKSRSSQFSPSQSL